MLKKIKGLLLNSKNTLLQLLLALCLQLLGASPQNPTEVMTLDPAGDFLPPNLLFCPPPKQLPGYAPALLFAGNNSRVRERASIAGKCVVFFT